jgi:hypothetical protein
LVEVFRSVRAQQLVIVSEPAVGKSVMALVLTLGLLREEPASGMKRHAPTSSIDTTRPQGPP